MPVTLQPDATLERWCAVALRLRAAGVPLEALEDLAADVEASGSGPVRLTVRKGCRGVSGASTSSERYHGRDCIGGQDRRGR